MQTQSENSLEDRPAYVVGAGAVGQVMASMLHRQGFDVTLVGRRDKVVKLRRAMQAGDGYTFKCAGGEEKMYPKVLCYGELANTDISDEPLVLYTTRACYLPQTVVRAEPLARDGADHVFFQGGVPWWFGGHFDIEELAAVTDPDNTIASVINGQNIHAGMISFGAQQDPDFTATLKGRSHLKFGVVKSTDTEFHTKLAGSFDDNLVIPGTTDDVVTTIWAKAAGSFSMSAFALKTGKTLGQLCDDDDILDGMVEAAETIAATGRELGLEIDCDYAPYFKSIADSKPDHMMSITKDPAEIEQIISWPIQIGENLGMNVEHLKELRSDCFKAAQDIREFFTQPPALKVG